jgi:hypothetical protein
MPPVKLSKSKILEGLQCIKRLWLTIHRPELAEISEATEGRLQAGLAVHDVFRTLHPNGVYIDTEEGLSKAIRRTQQVLKGGSEKILEATFAHEGVLVRADLIQKIEQTYRMYEVKSSTSVKDYHIHDAAVQTWVVEQSGLPISGVYISHIDNRFVYSGGGNYQGLFYHEEVTALIRPLQCEIPDWLSQFRDDLDRPEPQIKPGDQCYDPFECPYCAYCSPPIAGPQYPIEILPGASSIERTLREDGFTDLRDVPKERLSNERHLLVWEAVQDRAPKVIPTLTEEIRQVSYPRYYLDFETIQFPIPIWKSTRPYQQLPFQYSCHIEHNDAVLTHREFLDTSGNPPMRALAETLIVDLRDQGPIINYGHFERMIINILIELYPDLTDPLTALQERILDLLPLLRRNYYHPDMDGSWSIKAVLPTIAPDLAYAALEEVHDGKEAQIAFLEASHPETTPERREALRRNMLKYCGQDTLAMVRIMRYFRDIDGGTDGRK